MRKLRDDARAIWSNWILAGLVLVALSNFIFNAAYVGFMNTGIKPGFPDAIHCGGTVNNGDPAGLHIFYIVHHDHRKEAWYRLPPGRNGNAPALIFSTDDRRWLRKHDHGTEAKLDCDSKNIDVLIKEQKAVFFITSTTETRARLYYNIWSWLLGKFGLL